MGLRAEAYMIKWSRGVLGGPGGSPSDFALRSQNGFHFLSIHDEAVGGLVGCPGRLLLDSEGFPGHAWGCRGLSQGSQGILGDPWGSSRDSRGNSQVSHGNSRGAPLGDPLRNHGAKSGSVHKVFMLKLSRGSL